jgi:hypothetical protein
MATKDTVSLALAGLQYAKVAGSLVPPPVQLRSSEMSRFTFWESLASHWPWQACSMRESLVPPHVQLQSSEIPGFAFPKPLASHWP